MLLRHASMAARVFVTVIVALSFLSVQPAQAAAYFEDTAGTTYDGAVRVLADRGVLQGCDDGQFCPTRNLRRGQLATLIVEALDLPATDEDRFTDDNGHPHEANINAVVAAGIAHGFNDDTFRPEIRVRRGEVASMLTAAFGLPATDQDFFADTSAPHADAIDALAAAGITTGCSASLTSYCPQDSLPRWQAAVLVARAMNLVARVEPVTLAERQAQQDAIDAERQRQAELLAQQQAAAAAEAEEAERYAIWDALAECESGGNWSINTGNGYYGGLQFSLSSWRAVGGSGYPHNHTRAEQIYRGERLQAIQGWGAWPTCSRKLGLR